MTKLSMAAALGFVPVCALHLLAQNHSGTLENCSVDARNFSHKF